jgi:heme-degrading monooxygenase HmoA
MSLPEAVGSFVTVSGIAVPQPGAPLLEEAMRQRVRLVENEPGFGGLQVWRPVRPGESYRMVTWWRDEQAFRSYMRSPAHATSHARMPRGEHAPRPAGLERYWCVAG